MSSGRDVYLEKMGGWEQVKFPEAPKVKQDTGNKLDTPHLVTYYCRVNGDKITWGYMHQIDDNIKIVFDKNTNTFTINKL